LIRLIPAGLPAGIFSFVDRVDYAGFVKADKFML